jgi:hypothetical protein
MAPGSEYRVNRGRRLAAMALAAAALAAPATARADTTTVAVQGSALVISGLPGSPSAVEVRYRTADEAGFGGVGDRLEVADEGGILPAGADCAAVGVTLVSCDARPVARLYATLGDGDDVLVLDGTAADGVPERIPAILRGGLGSDVIRGGRGDDAIRGDAGRDTLAGWSGDDIVRGGPGADGLIGFGGDDRLYGEAGRDALFGQKGRDLMEGGAQNDVILARDGVRDRRIGCGGGKRQSATTDSRDPEPRNCTTPGERKRLKRSKRRGAEALAALATVLRRAGPP